MAQPPSHHGNKQEYPTKVNPPENVVVDLLEELQSAK